VTRDTSGREPTELGATLRGRSARRAMFTKEQLMLAKHALNIVLLLSSLLGGTDR